MKRKKKVYELKIINYSYLIKLFILFLLYIFILFIFKKIDIKKYGIIETYKVKQIHFCRNFNKYINNEIENNIRLFDVDINGISYKYIQQRK